MSDMHNDLAGLEFRKSSYSSSTGGNCIEVAASSRGMLVRDSKDTSGPVLRFAPQDFGALVQAVKDGAL